MFSPVPNVVYLDLANRSGEDALARLKRNDLEHPCGAAGVTCSAQRVGAFRDRLY